MRRVSNNLAAALPALMVVALAGCAVPPPSGPSVVVLPGQGKSYEQFQGDDAVCRQSASQASGGPYAAQAATNNAVGSAAVGTALGAAAGALIGSASGNVGAGAAIGAGTGLLVGSAAGSNSAGYAAGGLQQQYDVTYVQCMSAKGHQVPQYAGPPVVEVPYPAYGGFYYDGPRFYYPHRFYRYGYPY